MGLLTSRGQRPSFKWRPTQFEQGSSRTLPAPYAGLNLRDDITAMKPNEARVLENWVANTGKLKLRDGYAEHATSVGSGDVPTLATYNGATSSKLIAASNGDIYDVTTAGSGSSLGTGYTDNKWQTECYNAKLIMVNGVDTPQTYDGSSLSGGGWSGSGLTASNLANVALVRNRLWFCEKNSADVWYGGVGSITGSLTKFQLSQIASGGYCMAIGSWSRDAGDGADDAVVFVMSTGEIIVYQGDPATTFTLSGKFKTGAAPIGRKCLTKVGGELVVITMLGYLPVSAAVGGGSLSAVFGGTGMDLARIDPWGKIAPDVINKANLYAGNSGWQATLFHGVLYVSIPTVAGTVARHHALNIGTGSWSELSGWPSASMAVLNDTLYMGSFNGSVMQVGAATDNGAQITARASGAFVVPTTTQSNNEFTLARPKIVVAGNVAGVIGVDTDYVLRPYIGDNVSFASGYVSTPWGSAWGSPWASSPTSAPTWYSVTGEGRSVSVRLSVTAESSDVQWFATDIAFKPGSIR